MKIQKHKRKNTFERKSQNLLRLLCSMSICSSRSTSDERGLGSWKGLAFGVLGDGL